MHLIGHVVLGVNIAIALAGDGMHDDRTAERSCPRERRFERFDIVAVYGSDVLQSEIGEHLLGREEIFDPALHAVQNRVCRSADNGQHLHHTTTLVEEAFVAGLEPQTRQVCRDAPDGRCVRAPVVVDDDDDRAVGIGDVVDRLPTHSAGERAVADDRDDRAVLTGQSERLRQTVGVTQCCRCVRGLDPVVLTLGAILVPGESVALTQLVETRGASGDDLVHVRLMTRVEDHRVDGRIEDTVECESQLDNPQIRAQVAAGRRHLLDEELTDLPCEHHDLVRRQRLEIGRGRDPLEHTHRVLLLRTPTARACRGRVEQSTDLAAVH
ncbi:Uncharacterised protein [Mycobacteroides abscessus subsp. abscessus]|nr:Uncharacterised protein [Mycobacteroides abscessus subsp. abscessus]